MIAYRDRSTVSNSESDIGLLGTKRKDPNPRGATVGKVSPLKQGDSPHAELELKQKSLTKATKPGLRRIFTAQREIIFTIFEENMTLQRQID